MRPPSQIGCVSAATMLQASDGPIEQVGQLRALEAVGGGQRDARESTLRAPRRRAHRRRAAAPRRPARRGAEAAGRTASPRARRWRAASASRCARRLARPASFGERPSTSASARSASPRARSSLGSCASLSISSASSCWMSSSEMSPASKRMRCSFRLSRCACTAWPNSTQLRVERLQRGIRLHHLRRQRGAQRVARVFAGQQLVARSRAQVGQRATTGRPRRRRSASARKSLPIG